MLKQAKYYLNKHDILVVKVDNTKEVIIETFPELAFAWLEFEFGGEEIFLLTTDDLKHL